jgi:hypothetical protein
VDILASATKDIVDIAPSMASMDAAVIPVQNIIDRDAFSVSLTGACHLNLGVKTWQEDSSSTLTGAESLSKSSMDSLQITSSPSYSRSKSFGNFPSSRKTPSQASLTVLQPLQLQPELITVTIRGLRNKINPKTYGRSTFSHVLRLPADTPLFDLGLRLPIDHPSELIPHQSLF